MSRSPFRSWVASVLFFALGTAMAAEAAPEAGTVVSVRGDEVLQRAGGQALVPLAPGQSLHVGDIVRTGPYGGAALLFADDTQVRLQRNSSFEVEQVRGGDGTDETRFKLLAGSAWSRAKALFRSVTAGVQRGRQIVSLRTPSATLGIRGTDWHVSVDADGNTTATVLSGEVELANELGTVALARGDVGTVSRNQPPAKRSVVDLRDRPLIVLETGPEWLDMLHVRGAAAVTGHDDESGIDAAERALDRGDYARVDSLLSSVAHEPRAALLRGLVAFHRRDYTGAAAAFGEAAADTDTRRTLLARLAEVSVAVEQHRFDDADHAMDGLAQSGDGLAEYHLVRAWLSAFAGDHPRAIESASAAATRFPDDARFPTLLAHLYFLTDRRADMQSALQRALALSPDDAFAWYEQGLYHQYSEPDAPRALAAFSRALDTRPSLGVAWQQRGLVHYDSGDYRAAVRDFENGLRSDPASATLRANYGIVAAYLGRLEQAQRLFEEARALDPEEPYAELGLAYLDLLRGQPASAVDRTLKATVANPELPGIDWFLAAASYQDGNYPRARQALDTARHRDPDDPVPDLIGSVTAVDNFEAGEAIRQARSGFDKTLRAKSYAVDTLANARGGSATLGQAYSNLGLDEWGGFYSQLAFEPYTPGGYFYLSQANQFDSERARLGANLQGLLLDPTAVSFPTRYYEPFRQERHDVTLLGGVGYNDGGLTYNGGGVVQGLVRRPDPIAYYIAGTHDQDQGYRRHDGSHHEQISAQIGTSLADQTHNFLFEVTAQHFDQALPGTASEGDRDDIDKNDFVYADLGYQLRLNYHNRVMARVAGGTESSHFSNRSPLGRGLSSRDYSLIRNFGLAQSQGFYRQGLYDVTDLAVAAINQPPNFPIVFTGPLSPLACVVAFGSICTPSDSSLAAAVDDDATINERTERSKLLLQIRHLFDVGDLELTYGVDYGRFDNHVILNSITGRPFGIGSLFAVGAPLPPCPDLGLANPAGACEFLWLDPVRARTSTTHVDRSVEGYLQGRWKLNADLWIEGGAFYREVELANARKDQIDPRIGLGWRVAPGHWLRVSSQSALIDPLRTQDTLAPVATLGTVVPDTYFAAGGVLPATWYHQLRWDAEWTRRVYTYVKIDRQDVEDFALGFVPASRFTIFGDIPDGRLDTIDAGTNIWLLERVGLALSYKHLWSENRSPGTPSGRDLPLIPQEEFHSGLTFVHPSHVTLGVTGSYIGRRAADLTNSHTLAGYWSAGAFANWQPCAKHVSLTLTAENLLDADYQLADGFAGAGTSVVLSAEYRF